MGRHDISVTSHGFKISEADSVQYNGKAARKHEIRKKRDERRESESASVKAFE